MKRLGVALAVLAFAATSTGLTAQGLKKINELLTGYEEVPAVSTTGNAEFSARINKEQTQIEWELSYADLESAITQSHIHFAQAGVNGGISVFLCTNLGNGPAGIQACPPAPATITGTIMAADVSPNIPATQGARNQGIGPGQLDEFLKALRAGLTYVNIHTETLTGGEVRSQISGHGRAGGAPAHNH